MLHQIGKTNFFYAKYSHWAFGYHSYAPDGWSFSIGLFELNYVPPMRHLAPVWEDVH